MNEHFIKNIEIDNFKCFNGFKADGFKRVNLIGGKNNVGKTAFMEACYVNIFSYKSLNNISMALSDIIVDRYDKVILQDLLLEKGRLYISLEIEKKVINFNNAIINSNIMSVKTKYKENDLGARDKNNIIKYFLSTTKITNDKLEESYGVILENELEKEIDLLIREIDPNIKSFRIINSQPKCNFINNSTFIDIHELGDGFYKYVSILLSIFICKNGYLFIDEIENGIHYSSLDKLWKIVLKLSKEQNIQVFATTHSKECIESFARVSKELEDEDISFIELGINKYNNLDSTVMDTEQFHRFIEIGNEVRGW